MSKLGYPIDYVLDRMVEVVLGENASFGSHAEALGIPANTIKTWRRRGEVPPGYLINFAADWKVSFDWLLRGDESPGHVSEKVSPFGLLKADEAALLESYRAAPPEIRAALRVLAGCGGTPPTPRPRIPKPPRIEHRVGDLPERKRPQVRKKKAGET